MKLPISNIAWLVNDDDNFYGLMNSLNYKGLEIAPTRIFSETPYERAKEAKRWARGLNVRYGFTVPSMQSIWYGRQEKIFDAEEEERQVLIDYTKQSINFAEAIGCGNLVFECPRNRSIPNSMDKSMGIKFFKKIGDYADDLNSVVAMDFFGSFMKVVNDIG